MMTVGNTNTHKQMAHDKLKNDNGRKKRDLHATNLKLKEESHRQRRLLRSFYSDHCLVYYTFTLNST